MVSDEKPAELEPEARPTPPPRQPSYRPSPRSRNSGPSMATGRRISAAPSTRAPSSRAPTTRYSSASTPSQRRSTVNRPSSRLSVGASPSGPSPRAASTASFASLASLGSPREATPSKIPQPSRRRNTIVSSPIAKTSSHRRSHSNASVASGRTTTEESPRLTTEAKHLAARRKMEERDADVRINAFNKQLQDMIRQGREALGTTIEVEGNWDDDL